MAAQAVIVTVDPVGSQSSKASNWRMAGSKRQVAGEREHQVYACGWISSDS
jgi:hypothetical protein